MPPSGIGMSMRIFGHAASLRTLPFVRFASMVGSFAAFGMMTARSASADGYAVPGQIGFEEAVTPIAEEMHFFHNVILMPIITIITIFVALLRGAAFVFARVGIFIGVAVGVLFLRFAHVCKAQVLQRWVFFQFFLNTRI